MLWLLLLPSLVQAQPKAELRSPPTIGAAEGETLARKRIAELLAQRPPDSTNGGVLKIRARNGPIKELPVRIEIGCSPTNCFANYAIQSSGAGSIRLTVLHTENEPNRYLLSESAGPDSTKTAPRELRSNEIMVPFAGSDFWIADLGLEFLHWPKQRVLRKELRLSQSCDVLESINPDATGPGYGRVVSWIDLNNGGIVHADAYDAHNELLKQFAPTELKTVRGQKQVEEMEMRNRRTGSRSWIKFNFE